MHATPLPHIRSSFYSRWRWLVGFGLCCAVAMGIARLAFSAPPDPPGDMTSQPATDNARLLRTLIEHTNRMHSEQADAVLSKMAELEDLLALGRSGKVSSKSFDGGANTVDLPWKVKETDTKRLIVWASTKAKKATLLEWESEIGRLNEELAALCSGTVSFTEKRGPGLKIGEVCRLSISGDDHLRIERILDSQSAVVKVLRTEQKDGAISTSVPSRFGRIKAPQSVTRTVETEIAEVKLQGRSFSSDVDGAALRNQSWVVLVEQSDVRGRTGFSVTIVDSLLESAPYREAMQSRGSSLRSRLPPPKTPE